MCDTNVWLCSCQTVIDRAIRTKRCRRSLMWSRGLIANTQNSLKHSQCGFTVVAPALIQSPNLIYFKYPDSLWDQISMTSIQRHQNQPSQHSHVIGWRSRKAFPELYILLVSSVCFWCFSALQPQTPSNVWQFLCDVSNEPYWLFMCPVTLTFIWADFHV